jgi:hypothetical protein
MGPEQPLIRGLPMATDCTPLDPGVRPRPPVLRALGRAEPPEQVEIDGKQYTLERVVKHDSWAATAFYAGSGLKVVCKFNRQQRIGLMPMRWLGRLLARREANALRRLAGLPGIPAWLGEVRVNDSVLRHAVAHVFVPGRPLSRYDKLPERAFAELEQLLAEVHKRGMAYVDLHKRENILVGEDGRLYLLDFQICYSLPSWWPGNAWPARIILKLLQRSDRYHLGKHYARCVLGKSYREVDDDAGAHVGKRPWWIRLHRGVAQPFRSCRRWLLVKLGVRAGQGRVETEFFPEEVVRVERDEKSAA